MPRWIYQLRYASGKSLEFQISKSGQSWLWPPRFGELIGSAGCSNAKLHQTNFWRGFLAWSFSFGKYWRRLWVDMIGSRFIWLVGWLEAEGQSGLSPRRRQGGFPPLGPNDCVVIRRLVAVITDYWGGYSSCHTHAPTLSKAPCHSCHTAQCHMSSMWHVTRYQAPCLCRTIFCSGFACLLASHHGFRVATVYFLSLQNKAM